MSFLTITEPVTALEAISNLSNDFFSPLSSNKIVSEVTVSLLPQILGVHLGRDGAAVVAYFRENIAAPFG